MPGVRTQMRDEFVRFLKQQGCSYTSQRQEVFDEVISGSGHFDVEELVARMKRMRARASRATIYRTVAHLEQGGFVRKIDFDHPHAHYEIVPGVKHHEHLVCRQCGAVIEVSDPALERRIEEIARAHEFDMARHQVQILGTCAKCRPGRAA